MSSNNFKIIVLILISSCGIVMAQDSASRKIDIYRTSAAKSMIVRTQNDSVGAITESSGIFSIGTAGGKSLLFGYPFSAQTSHTHFYVDGAIWGNYDDTIAGHPLPAPITVTPHRVGDSIITSWSVGGVEFTQILVPIYVGADPQVKIEYRIENTDAIAHSVGLLLFLDTMIGTNDCAPIATPLGYFESEQEFVDDVPSFWQAFEQNPFQPPNKLVGQGIIIGAEATPPDVLIYGNFWNYHSIEWDYTFVGGLFSDSAVLLRWNPIVLSPGNYRTIVTYYGIGVADRTLGEISMSLTYPEQIRPADCDGFSPDSFVITLFVSPEDTIGGAIASLRTPSFLNIVGDSNRPITPSIVFPDMIGTASWNIAVAPDASTQIGTLSIELTTPGYSSTSIEREITITAPDGSPPNISLISPLPSPVIYDTLTINLSIDDESGIDITSAVVMLDGSPISYNWDGSIMSIHLLSLENSSHHIEISNVNDIYGCESEPFAIDFMVEMPSAPEITILNPSPDAISSCDEDTIKMLVSCPAGLSIDMSSLQIDGTAIPFAVRGDTVFSFASGLSDGSHNIHFDAVDELNRSNEIDWNYTIDRTPPQLSAGAEILTLTSPYDVLTYTLDDAVSGVDSASIGVRIAFDGDTTVVYSSSSGVIFDGHNLAITLGDIGLDFHGCSNLSMWIFANDNAQLCGANYLDTLAFSMAIPCTPPDIILINPEGVSACDTINIIMLIRDDEGVDADSAWVEYDGTRYSLDSHNLSLYGDTLIFKFSSLDIPSGDISIQIGGIADSWGNEISIGTSVYITVDHNPPRILSLLPSGVLTGSESIVFGCIDDVSGISPDRSFIVCDGDTMIYPDEMGYDGLHFFVPSAFWLSALDGDTLTVCAHIVDNVSECTPNAIDSCVRFFVEQSGPASAVISPPGDSFIGCAEQEIKILWFDPDGFDRTHSIININGSLHSASDAIFHWLDDTVSFSVNTSDISHIEIILSGYDILGFGSSDTFDFSVDRTPPVVRFISPSPDTELYDISDDWKIVVMDTLSGIDWMSISFLVNGDLYTIADDALDYVGDTLIFNPTLAGIADSESIFCAIHLNDNAYICSNILDTSWNYFVFHPDLWWELAAPNGVSACDTVNAKLIFHSNFAIDFSSIHCAIAENALLSNDLSDTIFIPISANFLTSGVNTLTVWNIVDNTHRIALDETVFIPILYDALPPTILPIYPAPDEQVGSGSSIIAIIDDDYTGVNRSDVMVQFNGNSYIPDTLLNWQGDTLIMALPANILGDIEVCITASDIPDICEPRSSRVCWNFTVPGAEPTATIIEPPRGQFTHNPLQDIVIKVIGENEIDWSAANLSINDIDYHINSSSLTNSGDTIRFHPSQEWQDGDTVRLELTAYDEIGLSTQLSSYFICDFSPPICGNANPNGIVQNIPQNIVVELTDDGIGVDPHSIVFQVDNLFIEYDNYASTYDGSRAILDLDAAGIHISSSDTVDVCVLCADKNTNLGLPNIMDEYCFWFLPMKSGCSVSPKTFTPNGDSFNDFVTFKVFSDRSIVVKIFTIDGALVRRLEGDYIVKWDGIDLHSKFAPAGPYIYTVESGGKNICKGTIVIAR